MAVGVGMGVGVAPAVLAPLGLLLLLRLLLRPRAMGDMGTCTSWGCGRAGRRRICRILAAVVGGISLPPEIGRAHV